MSDDTMIPDEPEYPHTFTVSPPGDPSGERPEDFKEAVIKEASDEPENVPENAPEDEPCDQPDMPEEKPEDEPCDESENEPNDTPCEKSEDVLEAWSPLSPRRPTPPPMRPPSAPPVCRLSGQVVNRFRLPVGGATVSLIPKGSTRSTMSVTTDSFGRFRFSDVRPGTYTVRATSRFRKSEEAVQLTHQNCRIDHLMLRL